MPPQACAILRAVVDEQQEARRGQAVDQAIEQRLGLGVDPVQVLEDQQQRLHLALAQQQPLDRVERLLAPLGRVERCQDASSTGTSSSARRAGTAGSSAGASVSSLPVTFSRICPRVVAALDPEVACSSSITGR